MTARDFLCITKPGLVGSGVATTAGAFCMGSPDMFRWLAFFAVVLGMAAVAAASCVISSYFCCGIDTSKSRIVWRRSRVIPLPVAAWYATALYAVGFVLLIWQVNIWAAVLGAVGALLYTMAYGYVKRRSHWGTFVGALSGATLPLAGYVAATGQFDAGAWLVFTAMFAWQMPHFYAIGIFRREEYRAAHIPVLPSVRGLPRVVWEMRAYGLLFVVTCYLLAHLGYAGFMFGLAMIALGLYWLQPMFSPSWRAQTEDIARLVFQRSLCALGGFSFFLTMSHVLL